MASNYHVYVASDVLTAAQVNTNLQRQTIIQCDAAADRTALPSVEGLVAYQADTDELWCQAPAGTWVQLARVNAWTSYTPTIAGWAIGDGTLACAYQKVGRMVTVRVSVTVGASTTFGAALTVSTPFTAVTGAEQWGDGSLFDTSGSVWAPAMVRLQSAGTSFQVYSLTSVTQMNNTGLTSTVPWTWATGDVVRFSMTYESAS